MNIIYKPATLDNLNAIYALELQCYEHPTESETIISLIKSNQVYVALDGKKVVGYVMWIDNGDHNLIVGLGVRSDYRRKGIGSALLGFVLDLFIIIRIEVRETNLVAQLFLKANDIVCSHTLKDYYDESDEDCYVFTSGVTV